MAHADVKRNGGDPAGLDASLFIRLQALREQGIEPYRQCSRRDTLARDVKPDAGDATITLAGRLRSIRSHGPLTFLDLVDGSGAVQLLCERRTLGEEQYEALRRTLSVGDILEVSGRPGRTRTGQTTVFVRTLRHLAKSLRPPAVPRSPEERFRARSTDLLTNERARRALMVRAVSVRAVRTRLEREGFLEFHTPVLQPRYGGGRSQPFRTHARAHGRDMYLRVTSELYLKRLIAGGFEQVYEIGPCFRNQGISPQLSPEFTMLEAYQAYAGTARAQRLVADIVADVVAACRSALPEMTAELEGLDTPWQSLTYREACERYLGARWGDHDDLDGVRRALGPAGSALCGIADAGTLHLKVIERLLARHFESPTFLSSMPVATSPLMRRREDEPSELDRVWAFVHGISLCDIASELNDPEEQVARLARQRDGLRAVHEYDNEDPEFIDAMLLGLPPLCGVGFGVERLVMILIREPRIREVIPFPYAMLRP